LVTIGSYGDVGGALGYLMEITDKKPIDAYQRADANAFREYLRSRGLSAM